MIGPLTVQFTTTISLIAGLLGVRFHLVHKLIRGIEASAVETIVGLECNPKELSIRLDVELL